MSIRWLICYVAPTLVMVAGCGGGGDSAPPPPVTFQVSVSAGSGGSVSPSIATVNAGGQVSFTITPDSGFNIGSVTGCGGTLTGNVYTSGIINASCTVGVAFILNTVTISGRVVNAPLEGASVQVVSLPEYPLVRTASNEILSETTTNPDGSYTVEAPELDRYLIRTAGGTSNGVPYVGQLMSYCVPGSECHATPYTTIIVSMMDRLIISESEAKKKLVEAFGFDFDPFLQDASGGDPPPSDKFSLNAAREFIGNGSGLEFWAGALSSWANGDWNQALPAGIPDAAQTTPPSDTPPESGSTTPPAEAPPESPAPPTDDGITGGGGFEIPDGFTPGTTYVDGKLYLASFRFNSDLKPVVSGEIVDGDGVPYEGPYELLVIGDSGATFLHLFFRTGSSIFNIALLPGTYTLRCHFGHGVESGAINLTLGAGHQYSGVRIEVPR